MILTDYHVHSNFSTDSQASMEEMIAKAVSMGFKELVITDHQDYGCEAFSFQLNFDAYMDTINCMKARFPEINLLPGVEIGIMASYKKDIESLINRYPFEFVIGSIHDAPGQPLYLDGFFQGKAKQAAYNEYFELMLECITTIEGFNVIGHLDYIPRYGIYDDNSLEYKDYADIIDEILKELISSGRGLEINTSGYRYGLDMVHPQMSILKRYRELGGEIVTVGSDAHSPGQIGASFDRAEAALKEAGFKAYTLFRNKKPVWKDLETVT